MRARRDIWVISDTHFNHENILSFTDEIQNVSVENINYTPINIEDLVEKAKRYESKDTNP